MEGDIGTSMFEHACKMGLEGIVSKHRDRAYEGTAAQLRTLRLGPRETEVICQRRSSDFL